MAVDDLETGVEVRVPGDIIRAVVISVIQQTMFPSDGEYPTLPKKRLIETS
jgi:hypothetical protein